MIEFLPKHIDETLVGIIQKQTYNGRVNMKDVAESLFSMTKGLDYMLELYERPDISTEEQDNMLAFMDLCEAYVDDYDRRSERFDIAYDVADGKESKVACVFYEMLAEHVCPVFMYRLVLETGMQLPEKYRIKEGRLSHPKDGPAQMTFGFEPDVEKKVKVPSTEAKSEPLETRSIYELGFKPVEDSKIPEVLMRKLQGFKD